MVEIAFFLDAVPDFTNLSINANLSQYSQVAVFIPPTIPAWGQGGTKVFIPTWPVNDRYLEVKVGGYG